MGTPSDWVSGERVFAPPSGTLDVDWLVPAVLEAAPGATPAEARQALELAWRRRSGAADAPGAGAPAATAEPTALTPVAERVVEEALRTFRA